MKIIFIGLSITSSWGNGHATTYRALIKGLVNLKYDVTFLEKDVPWYANHRDMSDPSFCKVILYKTNDDLFTTHKEKIKNADLVIVGSYVQKGVEVGEWVTRIAKGITAFYDIDTPVTLSKLRNNDYEYISPDLIRRYHLYLSFAGGPILTELEEYYKSPAARALYCSVDTASYYHENIELLWELGYLGTYSNDRQIALNDLLCKTAAAFATKKFVVAGPQYPAHIQWPKNVFRIEHLPPSGHRHFYNSQKFTLNITRTSMIQAGYSPSVRLFEAAACGVAIITDYWNGITSFFDQDTEVLIARNFDDVKNYIKNISIEQRNTIGKAARNKVLQKHSGNARALELLGYIYELNKITLQERAV